MTLPNVTIGEIDGALGILPPSAGKLYALVGASSDGPLNMPATFARVKDIVATFKKGPLVEAASYYVATFGKPVVLVRTGSSTSGTVSTVSVNATGTSTVTLGGSTHTPVDDLDVALKIVKGGNVGTAGITYQLSYDNGKSYGPVTSLGTSTSIDAPEAGADIKFALGTGDLDDGDTFAVRTTAGHWSTSELGTALDALGASLATWEVVHIVGAMDGDAFDLVEQRIAGLAAAHKPRTWIGNARMPNVGETEAAYLASVGTAFASKSTRFGGVGYAACKLASGVSGRIQRRPVAYYAAAFSASVDDEVNIADVNLGAAIGVSIRDANGNPDEHDEAINPGGDDARFITLRTWEGEEGVYVTRPRLMSSSSSDFQLIPHRRVLNLAHTALYKYFLRRLNRPVLVDGKTGFIVESDRLEIELGARAAMRSILLAKPKASDVQFSLAKHENVLQTKTLTGDARVLPLFYPEYVGLTLGFYNPALQVQTITVAA